MLIDFIDILTKYNRNVINDDNIKIVLEGYEDDRVYMLCLLEGRSYPFVLTDFDIEIIVEREDCTLLYNLTIMKITKVK